MSNLQVLFADIRLRVAKLFVFSELVGRNIRFNLMLF